MLLVSDINILFINLAHAGWDSSTHCVCVFVTTLGGAMSHLKAKVTYQQKALDVGNEINEKLNYKFWIIVWQLLAYREIFTWRLRVHCISLQKSICYFDNCICHQNCNCWLEIVPCGNQLWQYNTHGLQEQLKLLHGLGSLHRHQISAIHNKGHCSLPKIFVMRIAVLILICDLF